MALTPFTDILHVLEASYIAKIDNAVVVFHPVDVIDLVLWPFHVNVQPHQSVSQIRPIKNSQSNVPVQNGVPDISTERPTVEGPLFWIHLVLVHQRAQDVKWIQIRQRFMVGHCYEPLDR